MPHGGILAMPAAAVAAALALTAAARPAPDTSRVELELAGVLPMPEGATSILVLREKGTQRLLPLVVPGGDGAGRGAAEDGGLLGRTIEALGGRVAEVEIERAEESRTGARVRLAQGARHVEVRGRPSESVALAISAGAPIVTKRRILDEAGITPEDLARAHPKKGEDSRL
jgi:bifunctional DNase/RNase